MVTPNFRWRVLDGEIRKAYPCAAAVWRGQMQTVMQGRGSKTHHLRKLTSRDEGAIGFGDHKNTIESQTADVCQSVGQSNAAQ